MSSRLERVKDFYREHSPENIHKAESVAALEVPDDQLINMLKNKYARNMSPRKPTANAGQDKRDDAVPSAMPSRYNTAPTPENEGSGVDSKAMLRQKLTDFFMQHCPADVGKVDNAMCAQASEAELFQYLCSKYNVDPAHWASATSTTDTESMATEKPAVARPSIIVDVDGLRRRIRAFYDEHAPLEAAKCENGVQLVLDGRLTETELLDTLRQKYAVTTPTAVPSATAPTRPADVRVDVDGLRMRVRQFYERHAPSEVHKVESAVNVVLGGSGTEEDLFDSLRYKYAVEDDNPEETVEEVYASEDAAVDEVAVRIRAVKFYLRHAPKELAKSENAIALVVNGGAAEEDLFISLEQKYRGDVPESDWASFEPEHALRARVYKFYVEHAPSELEKAENAVALVTCGRTDEPGLFVSLRRKYNVSTPPPSVNEAKSALESEPALELKQHTDTWTESPTDSPAVEDPAIAKPSGPSVVPRQASPHPAAEHNEKVELKQRIAKMYLKAAPARMDEVDEQVAAVMRGDVTEGAVEARLRREADEQQAAEALRQRLTHFYTALCPSDVSRVDGAVSLIRNGKMTEEELLESLRAKQAAAMAPPPVKPDEVRAEAPPPADQTTTSTTLQETPPATPPNNDVVATLDAGASRSASATKAASQQPIPDVSPTEPQSGGNSVRSVDDAPAMAVQPPPPAVEADRQAPTPPMRRSPVVMPKPSTTTTKTFSLDKAAAAVFAEEMLDSQQPEPSQHTSSSEEEEGSTHDKDTDVESSGDEVVVQPTPKNHAVAKVQPAAGPSRVRPAEPARTIPEPPKPHPTHDWLMNPVVPSPQPVPSLASAGEEAHTLALELTLATTDWIAMQCAPADMQRRVVECLAADIEHFGMSMGAAFSHLSPVELDKASHPIRFELMFSATNAQAFETAAAALSDVFLLDIPSAVATGRLKNKVAVVKPAAIGDDLKKHLGMPSASYYTPSREREDSARGMASMNDLLQSSAALHVPPAPPPSQRNVPASELEARYTAMEAREKRLSEKWREVVEKEARLSAVEAKLQADAAVGSVAHTSLDGARSELNAREAELSVREQEVRRREHAVAMAEEGVRLREAAVLSSTHHDPLEVSDLMESARRRLILVERREHDAVEAERIASASAAVHLENLQRLVAEMHSLRHEATASRDYHSAASMNTPKLFDSHSKSSRDVVPLSRRPPAAQLPPSQPDSFLTPRRLQTASTPTAQRSIASATKDNGPRSITADIRDIWVSL